MQSLIAKDKPADGDADVQADGELNASVKAESQSESEAATWCEACACLEFAIPSSFLRPRVLVLRAVWCLWHDVRI